MFALLRTGHVTSCPAPSQCCTGNCEPKLYILTGTLAIFAGLLEGGVGLKKSMVMLSDGVHALADGAGDYWASFVAIRVKNATEEHSLRLSGNRVLASLLFSTSFWIMLEVGKRFQHAREVDPLVMATLPLLVLIIHLLRFWILRRSPFKNITREGIFAHIRGDIGSTLVAELAGIIALLGTAAMALWADLAGSLLLVCYLGGYSANKLWSGDSHSH